MGPGSRSIPWHRRDAELIELIRTLAARVGLGERRFDLASPRLSLQLPDGSRLFAVMAVTGRPCVSIRRHRFMKVTLDDLVGARHARRGVWPSSWPPAWLPARTCLVTGGTGAGKTTMLRALCAEIPPSERLVTIEDALELGLDRDPEAHPDAVAMQAREPNVEGEGEVTQADLVRWALRMSPDRVLVGEIRGAEVIPMCNAMTQGNDGSMATLHANSLQELRLLAWPPTPSRPPNACPWRRPTSWWPTPSTSWSTSAPTSMAGGWSPRCARWSTPREPR